MRKKNKMIYLNDIENFVSMFNKTKKRIHELVKLRDETWKGDYRNFNGEDSEFYLEDNKICIKYVNVYVGWSGYEDYYYKFCLEDFAISDEDFIKKEKSLISIEKKIKEAKLEEEKKKKALDKILKLKDKEKRELEQYEKLKIKFGNK